MIESKSFNDDLDVVYFRTTKNLKYSINYVFKIFLNGKNNFSMKV